jgi:hypothetical protein
VAVLARDGLNDPVVDFKPFGLVLVTANKQVTSGGLSSRDNNGRAVDGF